MVELSAYQEKIRILRDFYYQPDILGLASRIRERVRFGEARAPSLFPTDLLVYCILARGMIEEGLESPAEYNKVIEHFARSIHYDDPHQQDWENWFQAQDMVGARLIALWNLLYDLELPASREALDQSQRMALEMVCCNAA